MKVGKKLVDYSHANASKQETNQYGKDTIQKLAVRVFNRRRQQ